MSFSEKSSDLTDDLESNKLPESNNRSRHSILLNGNNNTNLNRSKSLDKNNVSTLSTTKSRHSVKNETSNTNINTNDSVLQQNLNINNVSSNEINYAKSTSIPTKQNSKLISSSVHTKVSSSNLCSNCNCNNANVNKNKKSNSRYFDTDIFLKFFFIV